MHVARELFELILVNAPIDFLDLNDWSRISSLIVSGLQAVSQ